MSKYDKEWNLLSIATFYEYYCNKYQTILPSTQRKGSRRIFYNKNHQKSDTHDESYIPAVKTVQSQQNNIRTTLLVRYLADFEQVSFLGLVVT